MTRPRHKVPWRVEACHRRAEPPYRLSFGHQKGQGPLWTWSLALPFYNGPCKGAMGNEGARTPLSYRVGLLHSQLVLLALASQEITIQQCMFPRGSAPRSQG